MTLTTDKLETAIAALKKSIDERQKLRVNIRYATQESRLAFSRTHSKELAELEILELKLRGLKSGFTN